MWPHLTHSPTLNCRCIFLEEPVATVSYGGIIFKLERGRNTGAFFYFIIYLPFFPPSSNIHLRSGINAPPELRASSHPTPGGALRLLCPLLFANFSKVTWRNQKGHGVTQPTTTSTACPIIHANPISGAGGTRLSRWRNTPLSWHKY